MEQLSLSGGVFSNDYQNARAGDAVTCSATSSGPLASGYWVVNGVKQAGSDDRPSYTWNQVPAGSYQVQGVAVDLVGNQILSDVIVVTVAP